MKSTDKYLITHPIFGVEYSEKKKAYNIGHSAVINVGDDLGNNTIRFVTKEGVQTKKLHELPSVIKVYKIDQIDYDVFFWKWRKKNNCYLPIVLDDNVTTGEVYSDPQGFASCVSMMIEKRSDCVAFKLVFN